MSSSTRCNQPHRGDRRLWVPLLLLFAAVAQAHTQSASYGSIVIQGDRLEYAIRIPEAELNPGVPLDTNADGTVTAAEVASLSGRIFEYLQRALPLSVQGGGALSRTGARIDPPLPSSVACWPSPTAEDQALLRLTLVYRIPDGAQEVVLRSSLPSTAATPDHTHFVKVTQGSGFRQLTQGEAPSLLKEGQELHIRLTSPPGKGSQTTPPLPAAASPESPFWRYLKFGVRHIIDWEAYDHLLFLAALVVVAPGFLDLLKVATAFTLSHSFSLALAVFDVVHVPSRVVEPAIALTIVYVAIENYRPVKVSRRWKVAFLLGLVHGLAFAGALNPLGLTRSGLAACLVSFNLGVEVGQVTVLTALFPLLAWVKRSRPEASFRTFVRVASTVIGGLGLFWFLERAFNLA